MSAQPATSATPFDSKQPAKQYGLSTIRGRLVGARRPSGNAQFWENILVLPAPDEYTSPSTVCVLSKHRLGEREEMVIVDVRIGGYKRSYRATDRETGEQRSVQTADVKLFAIED